MEVCWVVCVKTSCCVILRPGLGSRVDGRLELGDGTFYVRRLVSGVALGCLRRDVALCDTAVEAITAANILLTF